MDFNQVKELIRIIDTSTLRDFSIDFENTKIDMSKNSGGTGGETPAITAIPATPASMAAHKPDLPEAKAIVEPTTILPDRKPEPREGNVVEAPLVGTFYGSRSPEKPSFVQVGSAVKKGDVLCIIEAMKIMNEITSKYDGIVKEILVKNEDMVEYGQPLFTIG